MRIIAYHLIKIVEAEKQEQINKADGEAKALFAVAEARAKSIEIVSAVLQNQVLFKYKFRLFLFF